MPKLGIAYCLLLLLASAPLAAQERQSVQPAAQDLPNADPVTPADPGEDDDGLVVTGKKKKVCDVVTSTGSMMPRKKCRTIKEVEADQERGQQTLETLQNEREAQQNAQRQREMTKGA